VSPVGKQFFSSGDLRAAFDHQTKRVREAVEAAPEEHLRQADVDEWAAALVEEFRGECPALRPDEMYRDPARDVKVDVSWDQSRYFSPTTTDRRIGGYEIVVHIPFTALEGAELRRVRFHDLRHTFGSIAVRAFPLTDVRAYMGHADIQTTMVYVHFTLQHDAAEKLTRAFAADADTTAAAAELDADQEAR